MKMHSVNAVKDLTMVILKICFCKYRLRQIDKISVRMHLKPHMSPGTAIHADNTARFSFSHFNTMEEVQEAVKAMRILAWEG